MVISTKSREKVYHKDGCRYAQTISKNNRLCYKKEKVEKNGYRPCKWCFQMAGRYQIEKDIVSSYLEKHMSVMDRLGKYVYIRSDIGCWKVDFDNNNGVFSLYHRNHADGITAITEVEDDNYHRQRDHFAFPNLISAAKYIIQHDEAKKIISTRGYRNLPHSTKKQKKYYNQAERRTRCEESRRIMDLFKLIEEQNL